MIDQPQAAEIPDVPPPVPAPIGDGAAPPVVCAEDDSELTARERLFVVAYLGEHKGNASAAALAAGYSDHRQGWRALQRPRVRAAIDARLDRAALSADEVLARLSEVATFDPTPYYRRGEDGYLRVDVDRLRADGKGHLIGALPHF
jgi:hypothetical protein